MYYYDVCEPGYWWVTTAIEIIFLMLIFAIALWIYKLITGIYANKSPHNDKNN